MDQQPAGPLNGRVRLNAGASGLGRSPATDTSRRRLALLDAVQRVHAEVTRLSLPLEVPGALQMRRERESVLGLLEGYLVSRLAAPDRPLLVVIGGPTGAGKSTLLNSLVGTTVSPAGVLRPTTRVPVLLHNPADAAALTSQQLLPGLVTTVDAGHPDPQRQTSADQPFRAVRLVPNADLAPGLAILDSPDLDSWLTTNRELAAALLGVADLWLFVTTGTDYGDAVPWELLRAAVERRVSVAAVLNRMRPAEEGSVLAHFARMLLDQGLADAPVFSIPEVVLIDGRIPYQLVTPLQAWLSKQAVVATLRQAYLGRAVEGTLDQVIATLGRLVEAAADQVVAERRLRVDLRAVFAIAREEIRDRLASGSLTAAVRDPWLAAAHHSAEVSAGGGRFRRRISAARRPRDGPFASIGGSLRTAIAQVTGEQVETALTRLAAQWDSHPAAASIGAPTVSSLPAAFGARADRAAVDWLDAIEAGLDLPAEPAPVSSRWRPATLAVATLAVAAPPATAGQVGHLAAAILDERGASAAVPAWRDLLQRLDALIGQEEERLAAFLDSTEVSPSSVPALRASLESLRRFRREAPDQQADPAAMTRR